jgi:hypothetical protein
VRRHLAILRSICETFGGKPAYCCCGLKADAPVHFTDQEYKQLAKENRLIDKNNMTVDSHDGFVEILIPEAC